MSAIDCPCGQDCFAEFPEEARSVSEGTLHWQAALLRVEARKIGGAVGQAIEDGMRATEARMATARNRFIERVMGYDKGSLD